MILCAKCNKPVAMAMQEINHAKNTLIFRVKCHGEEDSCEIDGNFLAGARIIEAVAFK